jgi:DNA-3-methyladenine glycosylase I
MSAAYCRLAPGHPVHGRYHDAEYGYPARDESALFERLILEINQAGLSWLTILNKRAAFRAAYAGFEVDRVAGYGPDDIECLLADPGIIRNRLKIDAAVENARQIRVLRASHGSFADWLEAHYPRPIEAWTPLFRRTFRFSGSQIVTEFLISLGYLPGGTSPTARSTPGCSRLRRPGLGPDHRTDRRLPNGFDGALLQQLVAGTDGRSRRGLELVPERNRVTLRRRYRKILSAIPPVGASLLLDSVVPGTAKVSSL